MSRPIKEYPGEDDRRVIQGFVARNYDRMKEVNHLVVKVKEKDLAKEFIRNCVPLVATAEDNGAKTSLNVGFTFKGLRALLEERICDALAKKPELQAFVKGAVDRAGLVGDHSANAPWLWKDGLGIADNVHVLLSVYAETNNLLSDHVEQLLNAAAGGFEVVSSTPGRQLNDGLIHFGYKDGISQPNIKGLRESGDHQEVSPAGAFVLGYPSQFAGHTYSFDYPEPLGLNGTFAAFRIMKQDVHGFEQFLTRQAGPMGNRELVAARICGRWRDGTPLVISDEFPTGNTTNDFKYDGTPDSVCPFSAHIRRTNPRDDEVAGLSGKKHRVVRSTMPYGPPYQETVHDFEEGSKNYQERGLIGLFACVNLADQFEFVMKNWVMRGGFNGNLPVTSVDPMIGLQDFVRTRGAAYCFYPSTNGLQYIGCAK